MTEVSYIVGGAPIYGRIPRRLLRDPAMSANAVRLFALLEDRCGKGDPVAFPSKRTLAESIGSTSAVERAMSLLIDGGWVIRQERRRGDGSQTSNLYVLVFDPHPGSGVAPSPVAVSHPTPAAGRHEEETSGSKTPQPPKGGKRDRREARDGDPAWEAFWSAYPRKTGKGQARKAFPAALDKVGGDVTTLVSAALAYARTLEELKFACHPSTWLRGERWLDDLAGIRGSLQGGHTPDPNRRVNWRKGMPECPTHSGYHLDGCSACASEALAGDR